MKIFSIGTNKPPKSPKSAALNCLLVNQFATPGLGSLMGGRILAGTIQLLMALAGFCLFLYWVVQLINNSMHAITEDVQADASSHSWLGTAGAGLFALSWILAWFTSISLVRNAPQDQPQDKPIPPIIEPPIIKP